MRRPALLPVLLALASSPWPALAHPGHGEALGIVGGVLHPLGGLDHLCAMLAVGLWAGLLGGRARFVLPAGFVLGMAVGIATGASWPALPMVESGVLASVIVLSALAALALRLPLAVAGVLTLGFGVLHGLAHGSEAGGALLPFAVGVLLTTAALHALGVAAAAPATPRLQLALRSAAAALPLFLLV